MTVATVACILGCLATASFAQTLVETNEEDIQTILDAHNGYRANVSPQAADMEIMSWLSSASDTAKNLATKCVRGHDERTDRTPAEFQSFWAGCGQNLYYTATSRPSPNPRDDIDWRRAVSKWYDEVNDFAYGNGSINGKAIGHYTQVVWSTTNLVGCAFAVCNVNSPFGADYPTWYYYVCNYCPSGNIHEKGGNYYSPYALGEPASQCKSGQTAEGYDNKLCKPEAKPDETVGEEESSATKPDETVEEEDSPEFQSFWAGCGQNLYSTAKSNPAPNPRDDIDWRRAVSKWYDEVNDFAYGNGSINGKVIGHYYSPYALGEPASQCKSGQTAEGYDNKLCKPGEP